MISYVDNNHGSIWHRLSHFHSVIKFLFNLGVRINYIYVNDNHRSIRHRLSHFHSVIKILFNLWVRIKNYI